MIAVVLVWTMFSPREPVYDGRPVSQWVHQEEQNITFRPVMDSNAVPYLVKALHHNRKVYRVENWIWGKLPVRLRSQYQPWAPEAYQMSALDLLTRMGPDARAAIPAVVALLRSPDTQASVRGFAAQCLGRIDRHDPTVIQALSEAATDTNRAVRAEALLQLHGSDDVPSTPRLYDGR